MNGQLYWWIARASGLVAWLVLSASVVAGLLLSAKARPGGRRPNWVLDLHRFLGGLAVIFVGLHVAGLVADSYVHFGPAEVLVPLASAWRPGPVAYGVVALYLVVAVELTSLLRKRLSKRAWRLVHLTTYPMFASATIHGLTAGTDTTGRVVQAATAVVLVVVVVLTVLRVREHRRPPPFRHAKLRPGNNFA